MSSLADSNVHVREVLNIVNNQLPTRPTSDSVAQSSLFQFRCEPETARNRQGEASRSVVEAGSISVA